MAYLLPYIIVACVVACEYCEGNRYVKINNFLENPFISSFIYFLKSRILSFHAENQSSTFDRAYIELIETDG